MGYSRPVPIKAAPYIRVGQRIWVRVRVRVSGRGRGRGRVGVRIENLSRCTQSEERCSGTSSRTPAMMGTKLGLGLGLRLMLELALEIDSLYQGITRQGMGSG